MGEIPIDKYYLAWQSIGMDIIDSNIIRGHLETMVLAVVEHEDTHGFEIIRRLEDAGVGTLRMQEGTLYPVLYRMEAAGWVEARWEDGSIKRRGPRRRIYSVTDKGKLELARRRGEWQQFVTVVGHIISAAPFKQGE